MYTLAIYIYMIGVIIASLFHKKARLLVKGHWNTFNILRKEIDPTARYVWFHAASLGEFEQGRPLMERLRREHPEYKILLTFFSPSGYEVRKNYEGADVVCYLPFDTPGNVLSFMRLAKPCMAFFIKYEFWQNFIKACQKRHIPVYSVSSIFRPQQIFFHWYGGRYYKVLTRIEHFFVQNEESKELLATRGLHNVTIVGDTRFDRVLDICQQAKELPLVEAFKQEGKVFVAGSSWAPDEDIIITYFEQHPDWKLVFAPHVVSDSHLAEIEQKLAGRKVMRYTEATPENVKEADVLIINCYGLLSSIYRYGEIAYVGGGFGVGIHNVPEAAVYGVPVFIGPNNKRFKEAQDLLRLGGCFEITGQEDFARKMDEFLSDEAVRQTAGDVAGLYISSHAGAADAIYNKVFG